MTKWHYWLIALVFVLFFGVGVLASMFFQRSISLTADPADHSAAYWERYQSAIESNRQGASTQTPPPDPIVTLIFVGDMMFDRHIRVKQEGLGGYDKILDQPLIDLLNSADLTIGNLEGPITTNPSRSVGSAVGSTNNFIFTFDPLVVPALKQFGFDVLVLGNNHILNQGQAGEVSTKEYLSDAGLQYFGDSGAASSASISAVVTANNTRVGFVNYNQFGGSEARTIQALRQLQPQSDSQIVYTHWGNEYVPENQVLKNQAKAFVEAGADLIIGSHPHVITGHELVDGKHVYYSLGNFIFDQYFEPAVMEGLVVKAVINTQTGEVMTTEYYVDIGKDGITRLRQ